MNTCKDCKHWKHYDVVSMRCHCTNQIIPKQQIHNAALYVNPHWIKTLHNDSCLMWEQK
jgi:hypothetical protein